MCKISLEMKMCSNPLLIAEVVESTQTVLPEFWEFWLEFFSRSQIALEYILNSSWILQECQCHLTCILTCKISSAVPTKLTFSWDLLFSSRKPYSDSFKMKELYTILNQTYLLRCIRNTLSLKKILPQFSYSRVIVKNING